MYFVNPAGHGRIWTFLAVLGYVPAMIAGFHIAYTLIRAGKKSQTYWYLAGSIVTLNLFIFPLWGRLTHVSNKWLSAPNIYQAPAWYTKGWFMLLLIVIGAYFFGAMVYVLRLNRADRSRTAREDFSRPMS